METALFTKVFGDRILEKALELTAELGYDAVELMCREPHFGVDTTLERAEQLNDQLDDLGLEVAGLGTYTGGYVDTSNAEAEQELEDLEKFLQLSDVMETDLLRHGVGGPPEHHANPEHYEEATEWYRRAADIAAEYNKNLGIEIHAHTIAETAESTVELLEAIDRDNAGAIHDAGNMYISDTEFGRESIETLGDHLFHVKDELRVDDPSSPGTFELETKHGNEIFQHRLLNHGGTNPVELFAVLDDIDYAGYLSNECHRPPGKTWTDVTIAEHELETMEYLIGRA